MRCSRLYSPGRLSPLPPLIIDQKAVLTRYMHGSIKEEWLGSIGQERWANRVSFPKAVIYIHYVPASRPNEVERSRVVI